MSTVPAASLQRMSALLLCHWLYDEPTKPLKVEILMLAAAVQTAAGGFSPSLSYEARAFELDRATGEQQLQMVHQFSNSAAAAGLVAVGADPLFDAFENEAGAELRIRIGSAGLAAIYDGLATKSASAACVASSVTPRL